MSFIYDDDLVLEVDTESFSGRVLQQEIIRESDQFRLGYGASRSKVRTQIIHMSRTGKFFDILGCRLHIVRKLMYY